MDAVASFAAGLACGTRGAAKAAAGDARSHHTFQGSVLDKQAGAKGSNHVGDSVLGHGCNLGSGTKIANLRHDGKTVRVDWHGTLIDTGRRKWGAVVGDGAKTGINVSLNPGTVLGAGAKVAAGMAVSGWIDR